MYPIPGVSVILTIISFVLVMLTIFAGNKPGFMEDYHILYFNTSTLGENLATSLKVRAPMPEPTAPPTLLNRFHAATNERDFLSDVKGGASSAYNRVTSVGGSAATAAESAATNAVGDVKSGLSDIEGDLANELAKKLGIKEFYSIHLVDLCDGDFMPNATDPDATFNVTNCTTPFNYNLLNISALLDHELSVGPLSLNLADLGFTKDIQDKLNDIPKVIQAIVAMYIIAAISIGLTLVASIGAIFLVGGPNSSGRIIVMSNLGLAGIAVFFLLIGNLITTVGSNKIVEKVTKVGNGIGLYAEQGNKFIALTWATFALMVLAVVYWIYELLAEKKRGSEAINRAIGGWGPKSEPAWSETSSGLASRENSFPQQQGPGQGMVGGGGGGFPPTHAPTGMPVRPVSPMDDIPLEEHNYGRGTHEPSPVSPLEQAGYGYPPPRF